VTRNIVRLDRFSWVLFGAVFFPSACARGPDREAFPEDAILEERAKEYFDERFRFYPVEATAAGLHTHDSELGRFTESQMKSRVSELRDFRQRLLGIDLTKLSRPAFIDALLLTSAVKAELFELEEVEPWRRSPRFYSSSWKRSSRGGDLLAFTATSFAPAFGACWSGEICRHSCLVSTKSRSF
jgi:hypothetical protein